MKKIVLCVCALFAFGAAVARADELPVRPPSFPSYSSPPVTQPLWSGFYFGGNGGYGWLSSTATTLPNDPAALAGTTTALKGQIVPPSSVTLNGATAGGQIGYNFQLNNLVVGVEADYQWSHFNGTAATPFSLGSVGTAQTIVNQSIDGFGTVRARFGLVPFTRMLLYATGGLAYGRVDQSLTITNPLTTGSASVSKSGFSYLCSAGGPPCFAGSSSKEEVGWTVGAGGEYLITNNFSVKAEYLYVNFGSPSAKAIALNTVAGTLPASFSASFNQESFSILRAGVNFRF